MASGPNSDGFAAVPSLTHVADFIRGVCVRAASEETPSLDGPWFSRRGQGFIALDGEEAKAYAEVAAQLARDYGANGDISRKTLATFVQDALFQTMDLGAATQDMAACEQRLKTALQELHRKLIEPSASYTCFIPVESLSPDGLPMTLGGVQLLVMAEPRMRRLVLPRDASLTVEEKRQRRQVLAIVSDEGIARRPVARVEVAARDSESAESLAWLEVRATIDILNFFADLIPNHPAWLYLAGEAGRQATTGVLVCDDGTLTIPNSLKGPLDGFSIQRLRAIPQLRRALARIHASMRQSPQSEVSKLLLTSLRWAGRASVEPVSERAFLQYVIALEALCAPTNSQHIKNVLQIRVSHLLGRKASDRGSLHDEVGRLYKLRSDVIHDGSFNLGPEDLGSVRLITKRSLLRALLHRGARKLTSRQELARWFDTR